MKGLAMYMEPPDEEPECTCEEEGRCLVCFPPEKDDERI